MQVSYELTAASVENKCLEYQTLQNRKKLVIKIDCICNLFLLKVLKSNS